MSALLPLTGHRLGCHRHRTVVRMSSGPTWILALAGIAVGARADPARSLPRPDPPALGCHGIVARSQEPQPIAPPAAQTQTPPDEKKPPKKSRHSHQYDFLLIGTVFTEKGFSLEGAELHVRRMSEVKFRWQARSDRRGEFAIRVPQGADYQIVVQAKGFEVQKRTVDANSGDREDLTFRLMAQPKGKPK
ncbi:MAG TPA: carboxypeptidase-like regulatory domain-containing protein [Candidatus Acidoferrales bacterium]|nr:carboxypeptidase-like regulatory domain-containing protein [Candidatus Acidoferrales bacterium]